MNAKLKGRLNDAYVVSAVALLMSPAIANAQKLAAAEPPMRGVAIEVAPAEASGADISTDSSEIIVSARKRKESVLNVPVIQTVIPQQKLERMGVSDLKDLQKLVPGLTLGNSLLAVGTLVAIRGIGTSSLDAGIDQSVSLNLDGLSLGQGLAFSSGMFDVAQVEVLKGPQALFYGKSSPGGVISLRTADPTDRFEFVARGGYEFEARGGRGDVILSGPVGETLKARLAATYSKADGYFRNAAVALPQFGAKAPSRRDPHPENAIVRGTLLWNPDSNFSARLKVNYAYDRSRNASSSQLASCPDGPGQAPLGIPFMGGDNCKLDREIRIVSMDPAAFPGIQNNGVPYLSIRQKYGTLELNYRLQPDLTLTSTTGYYDLTSNVLANPQPSTAAGPTFAGFNHFERRDFTQEVRLSSEFAQALNFTVGAFFQDGRLGQLVQLRGNSAYRLPLFLQHGNTDVDIKTYSAFGQLRWNVTPQVEVAGGLRWTDEKRDEVVTNLISGTAVRNAVLNPSIHSSNFAPEFTLTYKPNSDLTLFAALKQAYKSGAFTTSTVTAAGADNSFGDERVRGGEIGLKSRLLDRRLQFNAAGYYYRYKGLQVGASQAQNSGLIVISTVNAGAAETYGIDLDATFRPESVEGLSLNTALNWNHGRYKTLNNAPCYAGQTIAQGCDQVLNRATGLFTAQNLSGTPLIRAPDWQAVFGFDYELPVGNGMTLALSNSNQYSSKFVTVLAAGRPGNLPDNYQRGFIKSDISLALRGPEDRWEVALIGKNVGNKVTAGSCSAVNLANGVILGGSTIGGTTSGPAGFAEVTCFSDPGRQAWLRFTYRIGG